jgi:DNA-binding MarR family transcriptional regulator
MVAHHPRHDLDDALLTPLRLSVMAALRAEVEIDFGTLRDLLETDDSALSKAISTLGTAGYLAVRKGYVGNRPRTWLTATGAGIAALRIHVAALRAIADGLPPVDDDPADR